MSMNKRSFSICILSILIFNMTASAQHWAAQIKTSSPSFKEIQAAFYDYWKDKTIEKGKGYKPFKRWEWYWEQRIGKDGQFPPPDILLTEYNKYKEQQAAKNITSPLSNATWAFMGPNTSAGGYHGIGRISCIAFHPTIANTFWVGTPAGGLWKTTDAGASWTTNTNNLPVLGVSDIAINPSAPNIMYIATGDGDAAYNLQNGYGDTKSIGVLKSIDGGATWNTTGLNWNVTASGLIRRLLINPSNSQILIAATSNGIYRTTNAGTSWSLQQAGWFMDMEFKPTDPNYVYASTFDNVNGNAQIYTSTNGGIAWGQVTNFTDVIRINLAVSANSPGLVDAVCANAQAGLNGLYYSENSGASFAQYYNGTCSNNLLNGAFNAAACGGQGNYDLAYAINPANANEIWLGGVNTWRTTDGGANWFLNNIWSRSQTTTVPEVHADKHFIAFHPLNNNLVYECNDGGLYVTNNGGTSWTDRTNGMGISQIYRIGVNQNFSNDVICGLQDNGSKELYNGSWTEQTGGDGMECIIDYTNGNIMYATYVQGQISKTINGGTNWSVITQNNGTAGTVHEAGEWVTPFIIHPTNNNILLVGKSQVYKTINGGTSWNQLGTIFGINGNIIAMAFAPSNPNTIYVATPFQVFKSVDAGVSWGLIGATTTRITYLAVSPTDPLYVYITFSGYNAGVKINMSPDGGASWFNYSGTLPNVPVNCIVYETGTNEGLYLGTDLGVYYTNGTMADWVPYNTGLPNVVVNELEISYNDHKLWAATFGRGLWKSDLYSTALTYTFTGNGNWNLASNWSNNLIPPNPLTAGTIMIDHAAGGRCNLNINQTISQSSSIVVKTGKNLLVQGFLKIQN